MFVVYVVVNLERDWIKVFVVCKSMCDGLRRNAEWKRGF